MPGNSVVGVMLPFLLIVIALCLLHMIGWLVPLAVLAGILLMFTAAYLIFVFVVVCVFSALNSDED